MLDAHQHFWKYDPIRYGWIDDSMTDLKRDFLPQDVESVMQKAGFDGCIAIQAENSEEETYFLLQLASEHSFIKGVVGWLDLQSPELEDRLQHFTQEPKLKGIRHTIQSEPEGFMTGKEFLQGLRKLCEHGLCYDILISEDQLPECMLMITSLPEMKLVIDHIAKPAIRNKSFKSWAGRIKELSGFEHVHMKLSGLVTEADWNNWSKNDLLPYLETCLEHFGPSRLMIGSDWPVCTLAASYEECIEVVQGFIGQLNTIEQKAIMGENASRFYGIS